MTSRLDNDDHAPPSTPTTGLLRELAGAGSYQRGPGYHREGNAEQLRCTAPGAVRAVVDGTERYVTQLRVVGAQVRGTCTTWTGS